MITLQNLTKVFRLHGRTKIVADNINATFPSGVSVGLLGRNGAGKSTLLKLIAGTTHPTSGKILSQGSVSFPVGLASALHGDMTGAQNTRFVARIYGADTDALMHYVEEFAELDEHFHLPVRSYSSGMRGRLTFGINMGLKFDTYLVDEITAVGDAAFKKRSRDVFLDRMKDSGAIFVSHSLVLQSQCRHMYPIGLCVAAKDLPHDGQFGHLNFFCAVILSSNCEFVSNLRIIRRTRTLPMIPLPNNVQTTQCNHHLTWLETAQNTVPVFYRLFSSLAEFSSASVVIQIPFVDHFLFNSFFVFPVG